MHFLLALFEQANETKRGQFLLRKTRSICV